MMRAPDQGCRFPAGNDEGQAARTQSAANSPPEQPGITGNGHVSCTTNVNIGPRSSTNSSPWGHLIHRPITPEVFMARPIAASSSHRAERQAVTRHSARRTHIARLLWIAESRLAAARPRSRGRPGLRANPVKQAPKAPDRHAPWNGGRGALSFCVGGRPCLNNRIARRPRPLAGMPSLALLSGPSPSGVRRPIPGSMVIPPVVGLGKQTAGLDSLVRSATAASSPPSAGPPTVRAQAGLLRREPASGAVGHAGEPGRAPVRGVNHRTVCLGVR